MRKASLPPSKQLLVFNVEDDNVYEVWTDGACEPNPGKGGWGYLIRDRRGEEWEDCGGERYTTNNRMELIGILMALKALPDAASAVIYSDSQYCVNGLTSWHAKWVKKDWKRKDGTDMPNRDLWLLLHQENQRVIASYSWVRGHCGNEGNERADRLASQGRAKLL